ncbi:unnamed protein product [Candidula unifasciata]|uniref:Uncharacterized protein n=1 Tax=Candidula unifasciata TaxID=100452 RepID=A0A8S4A240_9EUPU|nr:unnamed protein product [Candidula unifasciata]
MDEETVVKLESEIEEESQAEYVSENKDSIDGFRQFVKEQLHNMCGKKGSPESSPQPSSSASSSSQDFLENRTAFIPSETGQEDSEDIYDFIHADRGLALIINNEDFSRSKNFGSRPGSSYDEVSLYRTFKKLGFRVLVKRNLTARQMVEVLKLVKDEYDHANADCFVCCILTHGDETISREANEKRGLMRQDLLFGVDGEAIPTRTVVSFFNDKYCPKLKGKPRLFFLQACRGSKYDHGIDIQVSGSTHTTRTVGGKNRDGIDKGSPVDQTDARTITRKNSFSSSVDPPEYPKNTLDSTDAKPEANVARGNLSLPAAGASGDNADRSPAREVPACPTPLYKDCLVMYATPPGHFAWRRKNGAWFVQSLCDVLNADHIDQISLMKALVRVSYQVAINYQSENPYRPDMHQKKETPVIESMLVKDVYFTKRK